MEISVVIPNRSDLRVERLVKNLDENRGNNRLEVIVALNCPTKELVLLTRRLEEQYDKKEFEVKACDAGESGNCSRAYNVGIDSSKYPHVMILDSDLIIDRDFFRNICRWNPRYDVFKSHLNFYGADTLYSRIVMNSRMANTSNVLETFSPGIMFDKDKLKRLLGDKVYDEDIRFTGDCDLSMRIRRNNNQVAARHGVNIDYDKMFDVFDRELKNGIPQRVFEDPDFIRVIFDRSSRFYHPAFGTIKDFKDALIYGSERRIIINKGLKKVQPIKNLGIAVRDSRQYGLLSCAYNFLWTLAMETGTFVQNHYNLRDKLMN